MFQLTVIAQSIAVSVGIPINILVLLVRFVKFHQQKRISSYHLIIVNLAIADLISSIMLAFELKNALANFYWPFSYTTCKFVKSIAALSTFIDGFFILLLSCERYYGAITIRRKWNVRTTFFLTAFIWIVAILALLPIIVNVYTYSNKVGGSSTVKIVNNTTNYNNLTNDLPTNQFNRTTNLNFTTNSLNKTQNVTIENDYQVRTFCSVKLLPRKFRKVYMYFRLLFFLLIPLAGTVFFQFKLYRFIKTHTEKMAMILRTTTQLSPNSICTINQHHNKSKVTKKDSLDPAQLSHNNSCSLQCITEDEILISPGTTPSPLDNDTTRFIFPDADTDDSNGAVFNFKKHAREVSQFLRCSLRRKQSTVEQRINKSIQLKIHILFAISIAFFALSTPYYVWHFLHFYKLLRKVDWKVLLACTYFRYLHCFMNGLIYSVIDKAFRSDVVLIVRSVLTVSCIRYDDLASNNASRRTSRTMSVDLTTREISAVL